jgi:phosphatidylinositol dimannoside acyltransferase
MLLRLALEVADRVVPRLPAGMAYALADLAGVAWHRFARARRALVAANLARVCEATGRPTSGSAFRRLVRSAFRNHARYYLETIRAPSYPADRIESIVDVPGWDDLRPVLAGRPAVIVSWHLGNFEPFGTFLGRHGLRPLAPVEEIEPRALYEFLAARRGGGTVELVPLAEARRPLSRRLRDGGLVAIIGDRDLPGTGLEVTLFGHRTTMPIGPAALALAHGATIVAGRCLRTGPDRYRAEGVPIEVVSTGNRRADTATIVARLAAQLERDIAAAPDQWWGAFQPRWPDLSAG